MISISLRIVDGKNDLENVSKRHLCTLCIVKIHLDSRLNIQELYCYEFYEIKSVSFDVSVYNLKSPNRFQSIRIPCLQILATQ